VSSGINKEENSLIIDHKKEVHIYFCTSRETILGIPPPTLKQSTEDDMLLSFQIKIFVLPKEHISRPSKRE